VSEHEDVVNRPPGLDDNWHVVPAKFDPVTETAVSCGPAIGLSNIVGFAGAVNVATPVSPVVPVTVTVYGPVAPDATTNEPAIDPPAIVHTGFEIRAGVRGLAEIVHPVSPAAKPDPEIRTFVPGVPAVGNNVSLARTVKSAVPASVPGAPPTVTVNGPVPTAAPTVNVPVTVPPIIEHTTGGKAATPAPVIPHDVSLALNPVPDTDTTWPRVPDEGERVTTCGMIVSGAEATLLPPSVTVMV
jgi:hypothetical protein